MPYYTRHVLISCIVVSPQSRFLLTGPDRSDEYLWWVPLVFTNKAAANFDDTKPTHWMKKERQTTINGTAGDYKRYGR